jgi:O-antigen/teichoic acid export membrane protein
VNSYKSKLFKNGSWISLGFVIKSISHFVIAIFLARILLPTTLGDYFLIASLIPFVNIFGSIGLPQTLVRIVPKLFLTDNYHTISKYYSIFLKILFVSALVISSIFILISSFFAELFLSELYPLQYYIVIAFWMISEILQNLARSLLQSLHDQRSIAIFMEIIPKTILLLGFSIILFTDINEPFFFILIILFFSTILSFIFLHLQFSHFIKKKKNESGDQLNHPSQKKSIGSIAGPLWVTSLMLFVIMKFDLWLIGYYFTSDNVAIYALASKLVLITNLVFMLSTSITAPMIAELYDIKDLKTLEKIIRLGATISTIPAVVLLIVFGFFGQDIITLFFGKLYTSGWIVLMILLVGTIINIFTGCTGTLLMYTSHQNLMMKITLISGVITLMLTLFLIRPYGLIGVACSSSVGLTIQSILMYYYARFKIGIWTHVSFSSLKHLRKSIL